MAARNGKRQPHRGHCIELFHRSSSVPTKKPASRQGLLAQRLNPCREGVMAGVISPIRAVQRGNSIPCVQYYRHPQAACQVKNQFPTRRRRFSSPPAGGRFFPCKNLAQFAIICAVNHLQWYSIRGDFRVNENGPGIPGNSGDTKHNSWRHKGAGNGRESLLLTEPSLSIERSVPETLQSTTKAF